MDLKRHFVRLPRLRSNTGVSLSVLLRFRRFGRKVLFYHLFVIFVLVCLFRTFYTNKQNLLKRYWKYQQEQKLQTVLYYISIWSNGRKQWKNVKFQKLHFICLATECQCFPTHFSVERLSPAESAPAKQQMSELPLWFRGRPLTPFCSWITLKQVLLNSSCRFVLCACSFTATGSWWWAQQNRTGVRCQLHAGHI